MPQNAKRPLELLAPARDASIAMAAIAHGADAVYMGPHSHGARSNAANTIDDIKRVVDYAHPFRARVYATVNTIVYEHELTKVEKMVWQLYRAGVDAIIVQDMGLLRMDLPPIQLHASTQCDIRTPGKARFLEQSGFSQLVLPRELTLQEIKSVAEVTTVPLEAFIHGALCASYSGRCQASALCMGRSANRGECAQMCRLPYTLSDADGKIIAAGKHLLSLRDFNATAMLPALIEAGVSSFKIEGRLKDAGYVKNIVAWYRSIIDAYIHAHPDAYTRSSYGTSEIPFAPDPYKSFNRGFTHYFLDSRRPHHITSPLTPKSMGEPLKTTSVLNNGDGVAWIDKAGNYVGARVNRIDGSGIHTFGSAKVPKDVKLYRTSDVKFEKIVASSSPRRTIWVDITLTSTYVSATDERGASATVALDCTIENGHKDALKIKEIFSRTGNTIYRLRNFSDHLPDTAFIPASQLTALRRCLLEALDTSGSASFPLLSRGKEDKEAKWPGGPLGSADNVSNSFAERFYADHEAVVAQAALEVAPPGAKEKQVVMTTRHCILRELNLCLKEKKGNLKLPLGIKSGPHEFQLRFCCDRCEMEVLH